MACHFHAFTRIRKVRGNRFFRCRPFNWTSVRDLSTRKDFPQKPEESLEKTIHPCPYVAYRASISCLYLAHPVSRSVVKPVTAMDCDDRISESLCEKSMKMVASIIRASSFSIANLTLGAGRPPAAPRTFDMVSAMPHNKPAPPLISRSRISQQPRSRRPSFLIEPGANGDSKYVIHEEMSVDGRASAYIKKVREKHQKNYEASAFPSLTLPPPSRAVLK